VRPVTAEEFLRERHPEVEPLALRVRELVRTTEPDLQERIYLGWDGIGFRHPDGGYVCAIYPRGDAVRLLFEYGIRLEDYHGLLEGAGRQTRFMTIREDTADDVLEMAARYVREATAERLFRGR
jgi:hypothetical protein